MQCRECRDEQHRGKIGKTGNAPVRLLHHGVADCDTEGLNAMERAKK